jgi:hypothetical protein
MALRQIMPTALRLGPYRLFLDSAGGNEPPHIHVQRERMVAKFWLSPVTLSRAGGFNRHELNVIANLVEEHRKELLERWDEFFGR